MIAQQQKKVLNNDDTASSGNSTCHVSGRGSQSFSAKTASLPEYLWRHRTLKSQLSVQYQLPLPWWSTTSGCLMSSILSDSDVGYKGASLHHGRASHIRGHAHVRKCLHSSPPTYTQQPRMHSNPRSKATGWDVLIGYPWQLAPP